MVESSEDTETQPDAEGVGDAVPALQKTLESKPRVRHFPIAFERKCSGQQTAKASACIQFVQLTLHLKAQDRFLTVPPALVQAGTLPPTVLMHF